MSQAVSFNFRSIMRLSIGVISSVFILSFIRIFNTLFPRLWWVFPPYFHRSICLVLGIKIDVKGHRVKDKSVLFVSNHISWSDIFILGWVIKKASFVSKSEVAANKLIKGIADLHRTIYISRKKRSQSKKQGDVLAGRMKSGDSLILFPEGTTSRGVHVAPFKSTLFSVVEMTAKSSDQPILVQPVTICYKRTNNLPITRAKRGMVGLVGNVSMKQHLLHALRRRSTHVTVEYHDPIECDENTNRKLLAKQCENVIRDGLARGHRDRAL